MFKRKYVHVRVTLLTFLGRKTTLKNIEKVKNEFFCQFLYFMLKRKHLFLSKNVRKVSLIACTHTRKLSRFFDGLAHETTYAYIFSLPYFRR